MPPVGDGTEYAKVRLKGYLWDQPANVAGRFSQILSRDNELSQPPPLQTSMTGLSLPMSYSLLLNVNAMVGAFKGSLPEILSPPPPHSNF